VLIRPDLHLVRQSTNEFLLTVYSIALSRADSEHFAVANDVEAVLSAILATAWLLVSSALQNSVCNSQSIVSISNPKYVT